jgi:DNA repair exonuclease SbcCD nuclease subunit
MRFLFVGDPHARVSNLDEMRKLIDFLCALENRERFDFIFLAGDLFNDHAVVRLEVAQFWRESLIKLSGAYRQVSVLVGNHDMAGNKQMEKGTNALHLVTKEISKVELIDRPMTPDGSSPTVAAIPYMSSEEEFLAEASRLHAEGATDLLLCHQTFNGAKYDNGFYAPGGFDLSKVPQKQVISGHIHTAQDFDKCWYPGTPRWENRNDANLEKGVWDVEINGGAMSRALISTKDAVTPIVEQIIKEGEEPPPLPYENVKLYVELVGTSEWIKKTKEKYRGIASIKCTPKDTKLKFGSQGRGMTLEQYLDGYFDTSLVSKAALKEAVRKL